MRNLLWIDCAAGAIAGTIVLALGRLISEVYGLPLALVLFIGTVNLIYACYSFALATAAHRRKFLINLLVAANLAWALVCVALAVAFAGTATPIGVGLLLGEAVFVGVLAFFEWRYRDQLLSTA